MLHQGLAPGPIALPRQQEFWLLAQDIFMEQKTPPLISFNQPTKSYSVYICIQITVVSWLFQKEFLDSVDFR